MDDAIAFPSGHATNVTTIGHLFGPKDLVLHDELIHDSCLQGIKLSGASRRGFRHDEPAHLEEQLRGLRAHYEKVLILIEGVYSMDGDIATLTMDVDEGEALDGVGRLPRRGDLPNGRIEVGKGGPQPTR